MGKLALYKVTFGLSEKNGSVQRDCYSYNVVSESADKAGEKAKACSKKAKMSVSSFVNEVTFIADVDLK
jgi:hypothetical protein